MELSPTASGNSHHSTSPHTCSALSCRGLYLHVDTRIPESASTPLGILQSDLETARSHADLRERRTTVTNRSARHCRPSRCFEPRIERDTDTTHFSQTCWHTNALPIHPVVR